MGALTALWAAVRASRLVRGLGIALAALAGFLMLQKRAERRGRREAYAEAEKADNERASEIRNEADEVRRRIDGLSDDDMDEFLRKSPARRD